MMQRMRRQFSSQPDKGDKRGVWVKGDRVDTKQSRLKIAQAPCVRVFRGVHCFVLAKGLRLGTGVWVGWEGDARGGGCPIQIKS